MKSCVSASGDIVKSMFAFLIFLMSVSCRKPNNTTPLDASDPQCFDSDGSVLARIAPAGLPTLQWAPEIDLGKCETGKYLASLNLGSALVVVVSDDKHCLLWLGGETENPLYDGTPTQRCQFLRNNCVARVSYHTDVQGGPAVLQSGACSP